MKKICSNCGKTNMYCICIRMTKEKEEADRIIEMFGDKAALHVEKSLSFIQGKIPYVRLSEYVQGKVDFLENVLEIIKNK